MNKRFRFIYFQVSCLVMMLAGTSVCGQVEQSDKNSETSLHDYPRTRVSESAVLMKNIIYDRVTSDDGQPISLMLDAALPRNSNGDPLPVVVYIHGGAYRMGSKEIGLPLIISLAEGGYFAVSINYRLIQQSKLPAAVDDCRAVLQFLRAHASEFGIDSNRIGIWGHSAGGHLSALLGTSDNDQLLKPEFENPNHPEPIKCVVDFFGPVDFNLYATTERGMRMLGDAIAGDEASILAKLKSLNPITFVDEDDPAFLMIHGDEDQLVPLEHSQRLVRALNKAGVQNELIVVKGAGHGAGNAAIYRRVAVFFDHHLGGNANEAINRRYFSESSNPPPQDAPNEESTPSS